MKFFQRIFSANEFMPHGMCYLWNPAVIWLHVISDGLIAIAYYSIPLTLLYFVRKRRDLQFNWIFVCFAVFIVACGTTHLFEIWNIWHPTYWLSGLMKAFTALSSIITAILLVRWIPAALKLKSPSVLQAAHDELQKEILEREKTAERLRMSEENHRLLIESIVDYAIFRLDTTGHITSWNPGAQQIKGYSPGEIVGKHFSIFYPEEEKRKGKPPWNSRSPGRRVVSKRKAGDFARMAPGFGRMWSLRPSASRDV